MTNGRMAGRISTSHGLRTTREIVRDAASARANYLWALFRARDQHALVVARDLAGRDAAAHAQVDIAAEKLGVRLASADGSEHNHGNGGAR